MNTTILEVTQTLANEWEVITDRAAFVITLGVDGCTVVQFDEYSPVNEFHTKWLDTALAMIETGSF